LCCRVANLPDFTVADDFFHVSNSLQSPGAVCFYESEAILFVPLPAFPL
jgi:hypothetical protein